MTSFGVKSHIEIDEDYQGINLTKFSIEVNDQVDNDQIVDDFIRTNSFAYDSLRDCVKKEPEKNYLKRAFNFERVKIADFKKTDKEGTAKFLVDLVNEPDWGDDRNTFTKLLDRYFEIHNTLGGSDFYILSKNWFDKDDERLIEPESWVYTFYFLIISVDRNLNLLTLTEWTYD